MKEPETLISCKADKPAYIGFGLISGIPAFFSFLAIYDYFVHEKVTTGIVDLYVMSLLIMVPFFYWLKKYQVIITDDELIYTSLFNGRKTIKLDEISKYLIRIGCFTSSDAYKPLFRLTVYSFDKKRKPIEINMKVFSQKDLNKVYDRLDEVIAENRAREKEKVVLKRKSRKKKEKDKNAK